MAYSTISKPSLHFNTVTLYRYMVVTSNSITGVGFQPDWVWTKKRSSSAMVIDFMILVEEYKNYLYQSTNGQDAEVTPCNINVSSFDSDGFTVETIVQETNGSIWY